MKAKYILAAVFSAALLSSCSDFLDVQKEGDPTTTQYFTNDNQAIDAIDALYRPIHQEGLFGREIYWEQGGACDIVWGRTRSYNTLATLQYTGDESPLKGTYERLTGVISRANWVVEQLLNKEQKTALTAVEKRSLGEAFFMRAFSHFYVAYRYGNDKQGVPFVRYEDFSGGYDNSIPKQQATVMDNYKMIIEDLDNAIKYLPKFEEYDLDNRGRAHKAAAVAYKAKVYAYWAAFDKSQWSNVISMVNSLEHDYDRDLVPEFADVFSSDFSNYWTKEYLFGIAGTGGDTPGGSEFPGVILENKGWGIYNGWGQIKPSYDIFEEMLKDGVGNARITRSVLEYGQEFQFFGETRKFYSTSDVESGFMINKYMDPFKHEDATKEYVSSNGDWPTARVNMPLVRFAEMLLFRAEANLALGHADLAAKDINRVRNRSHLTPLSGNATWTDLYHERRCELAFEYSDHLYDLKRWFHSGDAEIKALAQKELNAHPRARHYAERSDWNSTFVVGPYADYLNEADPAVKPVAYDDHLMVFPYPSTEVTKSGGALHQNDGY